MMKRNAPWTADDDSRLLGAAQDWGDTVFKRSNSAIAARLSILRRRTRQATAQLQTDEQ
jgi:hypothetical protein